MPRPKKSIEAALERIKELEVALKKLDKNNDALKDKQKVGRKESWFWEFYGEDACA